MRRAAADLQRIDVHLHERKRLLVHAEYMRANQLLHQLYGSQQLLRDLRNLVHHELFFPLDLHRDGGSEWKRLVHREFHLPHHLFGISLLGELLHGLHV